MRLARAGCPLQERHRVRVRGTAGRVHGSAHAEDRVQLVPGGVHERVAHVVGDSAGGTVGRRGHARQRRHHVPPRLVPPLAERQPVLDRVRHFHVPMCPHGLGSPGRSRDAHRRPFSDRPLRARPLVPVRPASRHLPRRGSRSSWRSCCSSPSGTRCGPPGPEGPPTRPGVVGEQSVVVAPRDTAEEDLRQDAPGEPQPPPAGRPGTLYVGTTAPSTSGTCRTS